MSVSPPLERPAPPAQSGRELLSSGAAVALCLGVVLLSSGRRWLATENSAATEPAAVPSAAPSTQETTAPIAAPASTVATHPETELASCSIPDRGEGPYRDWQQLPTGRVLYPRANDERYDVLLHFHGGEAIRKVVAPMGFDNLVIAAVDAGEGSRAYEQIFYAADPLEAMLAAIAENQRPARQRHLIVSSWSAGYGAVREMLKHYPNEADAVVLLDSLHSSYLDDGATVDDAGLLPFLGLAKRAAADEALLVLTHSSIRPPGYASTSETGARIVREVDGRREFAGLRKHYGVEARTEFATGSLLVRGYSGTDKPAHCVHLRMLADLLRDEVLPRLHSRAEHPPQ